MLNFIVTRMTGVFVAFVLALVCAPSIYAIGQTRYVELTVSPGAIRLYGDGVATALWISDALSACK